jgi:MFS transporter, GlpU family, inner membrane protein
LLFLWGMKNRKHLILLVLIIAGESIFFLPFVLARIFRSTMLDYFQITNTELGTWFALYGLVAMASYLAGGPLADRFSARRLMTLALVLTSLGGFMMAFIPGQP